MQTLAKDRKRWTIGRLMVIIGGFALVFALLRVEWPFGELLATLIAACVLPWWLSLGGLSRFRWGFIVSAVVVNCALFGLVAYLPVEHDADYLIFPLIAGTPAYLWTGVVQTIIPWGRPTQGRANLLVVALFIATMLMVATQWPWHLVSWVSSPGLNRLADRIEAGGTLRPGGEWAGFYRIRAVISYPGGLTLFTVPPGNGSAGFARSVVSPRPTTRWEKIESEYNNSRRWHIFNSE